VGGSLDRVADHAIGAAGCAPRERRREELVVSTSIIVIRSIIAALIGALGLVALTGGRPVVGVLLLALAVMNVALTVARHRRRSQWRNRLEARRDGFGVGRAPHRAWNGPAASASGWRGPGSAGAPATGPVTAVPPPSWGPGAAGQSGPTGPTGPR
jgi:hypothetical protein